MSTILTLNDLGVEKSRFSRGLGSKAVVVTWGCSVDNWVGLLLGSFDDLATEDGSAP